MDEEKMKSGLCGSDGPRGTPGSVISNDPCQTPPIPERFLTYPGRLRGAVSGTAEQEVDNRINYEIPGICRFLPQIVTICQSQQPWSQCGTHSDAILLDVCWYSSPKKQATLNKHVKCQHELNAGHLRRSMTNLNSNTARAWKWENKLSVSLMIPTGSEVKAFGTNCRRACTSQTLNIEPEWKQSDFLFLYNTWHNSLIEVKTSDTGYISALISNVHIFSYILSFDKSCNKRNPEECETDQ